MSIRQISIPTECLARFCQTWRIREFSLFGSVLRDDFGPGSDVDVLLSFDPAVDWSLFDLVDMKHELEAMFGRPVDVVEKEALRNPFRRHSILANRQVLYAA